MISNIVLVILGNITQGRRDEGDLQRTVYQFGKIAVVTNITCALVGYSRRCYTVTATAAASAVVAFAIHMVFS